LPCSALEALRGGGSIHNPIGQSSATHQARGWHEPPGGVPRAGGHRHDGPIYVVAVWYKPASGVAEHVGPSVGTAYELSAESDLASYNIKHVITPIHFQTASEGASALGQRYFVLTPHDENAVTAAMAAVERARKVEVIIARRVVRNAAHAVYGE
jgi:hypothetical protein